MSTQGRPNDPPAPARAGWRDRLVARLEARGRYSTWVLLAALAGMFAATFPITILTVSLGSIAREFGARETVMAWVIAAPMLISAVALPLLGKLGDLRGHRRVFLLGTAAATATAVASCFAWSALSLIGLRTLAATLGGATQPTAMALIFSVTPRAQRVRAMGWWSMTAAGAPALGLAVGGPLVDWLGWRVVFAMQAFFSLLACALAFAILRETPRRRVRFDVAGSLTLALGVAGLMFALAQLRERSVASPWVLGPCALGALALVAFWRIEHRVAEPLVSPALFRSRAFSAPIVANALTSASYMGAFFVAPFLLQRIFGLSITVTSGVLLLRTACYALGSPAGGALGQRVGERGAAWFGCAVMAVAMAVLALGARAAAFGAVAAGLVLQGIGYGLGTPSISSAASNAADDEDVGIASAVSRLMGSMGAAFGVTLLGLIYGGHDTPPAFASAFAAGGVLATGAVAAALAMTRPRHE
jgi:EmrB/QacA subfamily drug resistance transporter